MSNKYVEHNPDFYVKKNLFYFYRNQYAHLIVMLRMLSNNGNKRACRDCEKNLINLKCED